MTIRFDVHLESDNEAFQESAGPELARILRALADSIAAGYEGVFRLHDVNGNAVGGAWLEFWPEE